MTAIPETMRATVLTRHGGPEALELRSVPVPRPGEGEVLVRVTAAALNNTDIWTREVPTACPATRTPAQAGAGRSPSRASRAATWPGRSRPSGAGSTPRGSASASSSTHVGKIVVTP